MQNGRLGEKAVCVCVRATSARNKIKRLFTSVAPWVIDAAPHGARVNYSHAKLVAAVLCVRVWS